MSVINRRNFIKTAAAIGAASTIAVPSWVALGYQPMQRPPAIPGKLLYDPHAHIGKCNHIAMEDVIRHLSTQATGVSTYDRQASLLSYEDISNATKYVTQIVPGRIAKVDFEGNSGRIIKTQELNETSHDIQNVGAPSLYGITDTMEAIERIHEYGGLAITNHFSITRGYPFPKINKRSQLNYLKNIILACDESEVFNAYAIDALSGIDYSINNRDSLNFLEELKKEFPELKHKGMAASDGHHELEQCGLAGNYMDVEAFDSWDNFTHSVKNGLFVRCEGHPHLINPKRNGLVSRLSFFRGAHNSRNHS